MTTFRRQQQHLVSAECAKMLEISDLYAMARLMVSTAKDCCDNMISQSSQTPFIPHCSWMQRREDLMACSQKLQGTASELRSNRADACGTRRQLKLFMWSSCVWESFMCTMSGVDTRAVCLDSLRLVRSVCTVAAQITGTTQHSLRLMWQVPAPIRCLHGSSG